MNVEAFLVPIDYVLEQLAFRAIVRIYNTPAYKTVTNLRLGFGIRSRKTASRKKLLLELLKNIYITRYGVLDKIE